MVICKYFLQGTCRFGANCKFDHQLNNHSYVSNYSSRPTTGTTNVDTSTLVKSVINDMTGVEKGGQWLLSSYAPMKEKPAFPGFEDHSMEEVRYMFYEAAKNGTVEQHKQNLQIMLQQALMKIRALQNPSPDTINMLNVMNLLTPSSQSTTRNSSAVFGGAASNPNPNVFGNSNPNPSQKSVFGNLSPIFGGVPAVSGSFFSGSQNSPSFGAAQQAVPTANIPFGSAVTSPASTVFSNQPPQFGSFSQQPNQSPFGQNVFQQTQNSSIFQMNNLLGIPQPQVNPTKPSESKSSVQHSSSIFGNLLTTAAVQNKPNEKFYSKLEDLTEEDIKWFQSDDLDISKIPVKPPTYEMCFPT